MKTGLCFGGVYVRWHKHVTICGDEGSEGDCSRQQGDGRGYFIQGAEGGGSPQRRWHLSRCVNLLQGSFCRKK